MFQRFGGPSHDNADMRQLSLVILVLRQNNNRQASRRFWRDGEGIHRSASASHSRGLSINSEIWVHILPLPLPLPFFPSFRQGWERVMPRCQHSFMTPSGMYWNCCPSSRLFRSEPPRNIRRKARLCPKGGNKEKGRFHQRRGGHDLRLNGIIAPESDENYVDY